MLGIRRTETPKATIMKIGFSGDVPYVIAVVRFCRYRLTGVGAAFFSTRSTPFKNKLALYYAF